MSSAASKHANRHHILALSAANILRQAIDFCLPLILIRMLVPNDFAGYRMLWLVINTVMLLVPLGMPGSLIYFLPRAESLQEKRIYALQTAFYMLTAALAAAMILSLLTFKGIPADSQYLVSLFVFFWVAASFIESLPIGERNFGWLIRFTLFNAILRTILVTTAAVLTRDLHWVLISLLIFVLIRFSVSHWYLISSHGFSFTGFTVQRFYRQLTYAAPFGLSGGIYRLRTLSEQWVVAWLFPASTFGIFSVAASILPLVGLLRLPVKNVLLPKMSRQTKDACTESVLHTNSQGNLAVSFILFPLLAGLFFFADDFVSFLFTTEYSRAADVVRVYTLALIQQGVEVATLLVVWNLGRFGLMINILMLMLSIPISILCAMWMGIVGAAIGSSITIYFGFILRLLKVSRQTGVAVSRLQNWQALGRLLLSACLSGVASNSICGWLLSETHPAVVRLAAGMGLCSVLYLAMVILLGISWVPLAMMGKRSWLKTV